MSQEIFHSPNSSCCEYFSAVSLMVERDGFIFRTDLKIVDSLNISFSGGCNISFPSKPLLPGESRSAGRILFVNMMYFVNVKFRGGKRSEEHTSELQSRGHLVCRLLL